MPASVVVGAPTVGPGVNDVTFPVNVDPGTDTGTFTVEVASPVVASLVASGDSWDCPPAGGVQSLTLTCSTVVGAPGARSAATTTAIPELSITGTGNAAGVLTVRTLVDGTLINSTEVALPEASAQLTASVVQTPAESLLVASVAGRFPLTPTFWIWWTDPTGAASTAGLQADTSDAWRCDHGVVDKPVNVPVDAYRCIFEGDPRTLTEVRTFALDGQPHTVHWVFQVGSVTSEITLDFATS